MAGEQNELTIVVKLDDDLQEIRGAVEDVAADPHVGVIINCLLRGLLIQESNAAVEAAAEVCAGGAA